MNGGVENKTTIGFLRPLAESAIVARVHYVEIVDGAERGRRHVVGDQGAVIGRLEPADLVLPDSQVSRAHCRLSLIADKLYVTDLGSTNGTFLDGARIAEPTVMPVGALLRVGQQILKYESRTESEIELSDELGRDLEKASAYIQALLPPPVAGGQLQCDWVYLPSTKLGGDAFGYSHLEDGVFIAYLLDVSGHGAGAAMHAVSVLNILARRALPDTDMRDPSQVLAALNAMFPMESSGDMYFTMWYGVYDLAGRRLTYASAGHHAAYLVNEARSDAQPLRTRNPMIGGVPGARFAAATVDIPPAARLYIFSDGVFEILTRDGAQWGLQDFVPHLLAEPQESRTESERLFDLVKSVAKPGGFDDDFSLVVLKFD